MVSPGLGLFHAVNDVDELFVDLVPQALLAVLGSEALEEAPSLLRIVYVGGHNEAPRRGEEGIESGLSVCCSENSISNSCRALTGGGCSVVASSVVGTISASSIGSGAGAAGAGRSCVTSTRSGVSSSGR